MERKRTGGALRWSTGGSLVARINIREIALYFVMVMFIWSCLTYTLWKIENEGIQTKSPETDITTPNYGCVLLGY